MYVNFKPNSLCHLQLESRFILFVEQQDEEVVASATLLDRRVETHLQTHQDERHYSPSAPPEGHTLQQRLSEGRVII